MPRSQVAHSLVRERYYKLWLYDSSVVPEQSPAQQGCTARKLCVRLGTPVDLRCHVTMLAASESRPLGHKLCHDSSDSLAGPAFYGSGGMPIAGSDRLHAHLEYTNRDNTSWNCDCCPREATYACYACLTRLEVTSLAYLNSMKSLTSTQPANVVENQQLGASASR